MSAKINIHATAELCLPRIESAMEDFLKRSEQVGIRFNTEMTRYHLASGGKRLRALIPCWVFEACGKDPISALSLGCALEMVHNATLVHDDLQDGDVMRRGFPTVWKKWSPAQAINCGDIMYQFALELLLEQPMEASTVRGIARRFLQGITQVIEGQAQEFLLKDEALPTLARYIEVVEGKTAALVATALSIAVQALGKDKSVIADVEQAGMDLGVLFQMQDDVLDVYGDKGRDQKATDIAEGKISILVAQCLESANSSDQKRILEILRKPREQTSSHEIAEVVELFDRYETLPKVLSRIAELRSRIANLKIKTTEPRLHALLVDLGELFLKPIAHLVEAAPPLRSKGVSS
jgi:geranylgeranyl pyrophosphate synthase